MNRVVHFEIPADDVERAKKFYGDVFGWGMMPVPEMSYTILTTAPTDENRMITETGAINGGMFKREAPFAGPVIVIDVPNVDDALGKVAAHGGTILKEKEAVGVMGFVGYFKDPEQNIIGLWETVKK